MVKTVADFHTAFLEAEEEVKFAELFIDGLASIENDDCVSAYQPRGVVIPSINELRYAAKHLSSAMQEGVSEEYRSEHINRGIRHCIRARLDALKAVILFLVRDFHRFTDDYRLLNISAEDQERFNAHRQTVWEVLSKLSKDRSQSTKEDCENLKTAIENLHNVYCDVQKFRGVFNKLVEKIDKQGKTSTKQWVIGIALAIWALTVSIYALFRC